MGNGNMDEGGSPPGSPMSSRLAGVDTNDYKSYSICTSLVATNGVPLTGEGGLIRDEAIIHISRNMAVKNGNPRRHVTAGLTEVYRWGHTWDPLPEWWRGV